MGGQRGKFARVSTGWWGLRGEVVGGYAMGEKELNLHLPGRKLIVTA